MPAIPSVQTVERFLQRSRSKLSPRRAFDGRPYRAPRRAPWPVRFASLTLIEPMAFGVLDPVTDKAAIDYDRNMINDFYPNRGRVAERLVRIHKRVSDKNGRFIDRARVELMAVIPQIVEEAPLVSCDDPTGDDFSGIGADLFDRHRKRLTAGGAHYPAIAAAIPGAEATQLAGAGHMPPSPTLRWEMQSAAFKALGRLDGRVERHAFVQGVFVESGHHLTARQSPQFVRANDRMQIIEPVGCPLLRQLHHLVRPVTAIGSTILFVGGRRSAS